MTIEEQKQLFTDLTEKAKETLAKKGHDYANSDVLSNFKLAAELAGNTGKRNCLSLIATKVVRLSNLFDKQEDESFVIENESIEDSILDLFNYSFLLYCLEQESKGLLIKQ